MKKLQSFYLILTFLILIPHSLFSMDLRSQPLPVQKKQLAMAKVITRTLKLFNQKSNLPLESKAEIFQNKGFYIQIHEGPNKALTVFKIPHVSKLSPISEQEANKAHQLLKVYDFKMKHGICSAMFRYSSKQLLPSTKEQAAFLLATPLLIEAVRTKEIVSPNFLNPQQKQILSAAHPQHPQLIAIQRTELKSFFESGKLQKIFKIESGFASSTSSTQTVNKLNHLLRLYHQANHAQKIALSHEINVHIDTVCDFALNEGFALGTIVQTNEGPQKIEHIQEGDLVLSKDLENNAQIVCPVTNISKEIIPSYVEIRLEHETIITALGQKFHLGTLNKWITAQELIHSPELQAQFGEPILEIREVNESIEIYKLTIAHQHNFYVTEKQLLAHNFIFVVAPAAPAAVGITATIVIPAVKSAGFAVGAWIAAKLFESFKHRPTIGAHEFYDNNQDKTSIQKSESKNAIEPKRLGNSNQSPKNNKSDKKAKEDKTPKPMGCGNNIGSQDQHAPDQQKQCNHSSQEPKPMGCGTAELQKQFDPREQKQCNYSKETQHTFEQNKDHKTNDEYEDSKSISELLSKDDIIHTKDNKKKLHKGKNKQKEKQPKDNISKSDKKPEDTKQDEKHPNGIYEGAPYHHQNSKGEKSPAPKNGQKALDNSIPVKKDTPGRRVGTSEGEIVILDTHEPGKYHGHVRDYKDVPDKAKAALHKARKVNLSGKILE